MSGSPFQFFIQPSTSSASTSTPSAADHPLDALDEQALINLRTLNDRILTKAAKEKRNMSTKYFNQILVQQSEIEFRLERMSQAPVEDNVEVDMDPNRPPTPPYVLSTKWKAIHAPFPQNNQRKRTVDLMDPEQAAEIERRAMQAQAPKKTPKPMPNIHPGLSEEEKHSRILDFMNHRESDEEQDEDDDEDEGELDFEDLEEDEEMRFEDTGMGAHGGEWINTDDLSQIIQVNPGVVASGGRYFNGVMD